jgi:hypothetical protein
MRWWLGGQATCPVGWVEGPPPTFSTDSGFSSSGRRVATTVGPNRLKPWLASQRVGPVGRPLGSLALGSGPLGLHVKYTPMVMMILTFGQLHVVVP